MSILDYFELVDINKLSFSPNETQNRFTYMHIDKSTNIQKLNEYDIAILGVEEERNTNNKGTAQAPDKIREQLYKLNRNEKAKILDLGNLRLGKSLKDTYIAIGDIVFELINKNILPIIIGGGQDLTYGAYLGFDKLNQPINLVTIDSKLDLGYQKNNFTSESYIGQILLEKGKNLFNYSNIGYQSYYSNKEELNLINKMNFDAFRLGYVRSNMHDIEPVLRDADLVSVDLKSIKQSDAPANQHPSPNGFYSEEICQLAKYAGISDKVKCFGVYEVNPAFDANNQSTALVAQIIWYFIDGFLSRKGDFPVEGTKQYTKHIVSFDNSQQNIVFYQNNYNKSWWLEVPNLLKPESRLIVACTANDYKLACKQEVPERWLKVLQKLN